MAFFVLATVMIFAANKEIKIQTNMTCETCKGKIESGLKNTAGVTSSNADVSSKVVTVKYDDSKTTSDKITKKIKDLGYSATVSSNKMDKSSCNTGSSSCSDKGMKLGSSKKSCCDVKATKSNAKSK